MEVQRQSRVVLLDDHPRRLLDGLRADAPLHTRVACRSRLSQLQHGNPSTGKGAGCSARQPLPGRAAAARTARGGGGGERTMVASGRRRGAGGGAVAELVGGRPPRRSRRAPSLPPHPATPPGPRCCRPPNPTVYPVQTSRLPDRVAAPASTGPCTVQGTGCTPVPVTRGLGPMFDAPECHDGSTGCGVPNVRRAGVREGGRYQRCASPLLLSPAVGRGPLGSMV